MYEQILEILKKIELDKKYLLLCQIHSDFDGKMNLTRKDVEPILKSYDSAFIYIPRDKTFMKEFLFGEYTVRFFISFKSGIIGFGYLIWKEGENHNFYKGNLVTLTELIDPNFEEKVKYKSPIVSSIDEYNLVPSKIFELYTAFKRNFEKIV